MKTFFWRGGNFWYIFWVDFKLWWLLFLDNGKNCQIFLLAMNEGNISTESAAGDYLTSNMRFVTELWQNTFHKKKKRKNQRDVMKLFLIASKWCKLNNNVVRNINLHNKYPYF